MTVLTNNSSVSSANSTTSDLGSDGVFTGTGEDISVFESITLIIKASHDSAANGVQLQFGQSTSDWDCIISITYTAPGHYEQTFKKKGTFFRLVYTNGGTAHDASSFRLQCVKNISNPEKQIYFQEASMDAFARLRVSNPVTLYQVSHNTGLHSHEVTSKTVNGGTETHVPNESAVNMAVTTTSGSQCIRQSRPYIVYQPGKSMLVMETGVLNANSNGVDCNTKIGLFDDENGVFFSYKNGLFVTLRSHVTGTTVDTPSAQA